VSGLWRDIFSSPAARRIQLEPGQALFRQNDPISSIFLVESGRLRLVRHLEDGTPVVMHTARGGETFAEGALSAEKYHCDAVAETKAQVLSLAKKVVLDHLEEHPEAGLAMVLQMARQVRDLRTRLELRNIRRADERLRQLFSTAPGRALPRKSGLPANPSTVRCACWRAAETFGEPATARFSFKLL
jgi:CRP-like cAMP-binding protein